MHALVLDAFGICEYFIISLCIIQPCLCDIYILIIYFLLCLYDKQYSLFHVDKAVYRGISVFTYIFSGSPLH